LSNFINKKTHQFRLKALSHYSNYFFNLNKWPIDKAPKVSNSSYLVGFGFLFLFNVYAYQTIDRFVLFAYNWFSFSLQIPCIFVIIAFVAFMRFRIIFIPAFCALILFFYLYFGTKVSGSKYYKNYISLTSDHLVINWEIFLFFFFFLGWAFKVTKKYLLESYTLQESFFYKSALPGVYLFEVTTFIVIIAWRHLNQGLMGYSSIMYLKYYKMQYVSSALLSKLLFFVFVYTFFFFLLNLLKGGMRLAFFFFFFLLFLILTVFLFKEFAEFWAFLHQTAPSNLAKFTYFKFIIYIMFFNFLHVYLVAGFSLLGFAIYFTKFDSSYSDFYDILYINIKNFFLIMWLTVILFLSIYLINDLFLYLGTELVVSLFDLFALL
jgi:hypothetical protein